MVAAAPAAAGPSRPPASIEDFLWNIHSVLVATPGPLQLDNLKEAYSAHLGHKCVVERFLVVGEGGLAATLKRIPHVVTLFTDSGGVQCVKPTQAAGFVKQDIIEADQNYRRELVKKNAAAKAAAKGAPAKAPTPAAAVAKTPAASPAAGAIVAAGEKRAAEGAAAGAPASKQAKAAPAAAAAAPGADSDTETLARMLVQGVVRVLQNREKATKGALPIADLEAEFKALWKVPFNLAQASETDAVTFLQKWPNKVEVSTDSSGQPVVQLPKKGAAEKPTATKAPAAVKTATPAVPADAKKGTDAPAVAKGATPGTAAKAPPGKAAEIVVEASKNGGDIAKRAGGPTRPPATIEDFLWNMHSVLEAYGIPLPADQLKEVYSKHLGHKCAIERFLVVGDGGLAATLKRIPHVVTVVIGSDGNTDLKQTLPSGITREQLVAADQAYRKQLAAKNQAAKAAAATGGKAPAAPGAAAAPATGTPPAKAPGAVPAAATPAAAATTRPAPDAAGGPEAKKPRPEDAETLAKMMIQGIVRVLQNRVKEAKGPLPIGNLEEEFKTLWKVPFQLRQAGETDLVAFLEKWPQKVELSTEAGVQVLTLAKKGKAAAASKENDADTGAVVAKSALPAGDVSEPQTLAEAKQQATEILQAMRDCVRRQEALVNSLGRLTA